MFVYFYNMKKLVLSIVFILCTGVTFAQYGYRDSNRIGIAIGVNQFNLSTKNFQTKPDLGWNAGLSVRGNFYDKWDMVYAIQFSENNFSVQTNNIGFGYKDVNYTLPSAQFSLQLSYVLADNVSVEFGPIVQFNGKFKIKPEDENNVISGTTLLAKDIVDISKFNLYPTVGLTAGVKHFRFNVSYQYGIGNMLGNLNSKNLGYSFKGNPSMLNGNILLYL